MIWTKIFFLFSLMKRDQQHTYRLIPQVGSKHNKMYADLTPISWRLRDNVVLYILILLPNPRLLCLPLSGHVVGKLKMRHVMCNQLFLVLFWPTSIRFIISTISNPSQFLIKALHISKSSQPCFLYLVYHTKRWKFDLLLWTWTTSWASFLDWVRPSIRGVLKEMEIDDWNMSKEQVQPSWLTYLQQVLMKKEVEDRNMSKKQVQRTWLTSYNTAE